MPAEPAPCPPTGATPRPLLALLAAVGADRNDSRGDRTGWAGDAGVGAVATRWLDDEQALAESVEAVATGVPGERWVLVLPRGRARVAGRVRGVAPSRLRVRTLLGAASVEVVASYLLWPTGGAPRVAWEEGDRRARRWAQRTGLLVTGGGRLGWRALARAPFVGPVLDALAPARAVVVERRRP